MGTLSESELDAALTSGSAGCSWWLEAAKSALREVKGLRAERASLRAEVEKLKREAADAVQNWKDANGYDDLIDAYVSQTEEVERLKKGCPAHPECTAPCWERVIGCPAQEASRRTVMEEAAGIAERVPVTDKHLRWNAHGATKELQADIAAAIRAAAKEAKP